MPAPPPTTGRIDIRVDNDVLRNLDLTPAHDALREFIGISGEQQIVLFEVSRQAGCFPNCRSWLEICSASQNRLRFT